LVRPGTTRNGVLAVLVGGQAKCFRDILLATGLGDAAVRNSLHRLWRNGVILRTEKTLYEEKRIFKGRGGVSRTTRPYHLYILKLEGINNIVFDGHRFVGFAEEFLDVRGRARVNGSKARRILEFLRENRNRAFFSREIAEALKSYGVLVRDVMSNVRRFERKGLVYVRGYKGDDGQTPFSEGYLITWLDQDVARDKSLDEAVERTTAALANRSSGSPIIERIQKVRDVIVEHSKLRRLVSFNYIMNGLDCSIHKAEDAVKRSLQLYPDLKELKIFGAYRYYYHASLGEEDLKAVVALKKNYIRKTKGRANRIGHNWEAVAEWFIDKFTVGAKFSTQNHRESGMDPRRITLHLIKGVGGRRNSAEVDRVWMVNPGIFAPTITYVLSCKWGLVSKKHVDDFRDVLRWSKEFGVDTPEGREAKQGVVGVFAASSFNPKEKVQLKDGAQIGLASYAARMNMQLLKAADFNEKLRERGTPKEATVQKICRVAKDEGDVRQVIDKIWDDTESSAKILSEIADKNSEIYSFEKMLEETEE